ncbi:hypothetical protein ANN_05955 [Periplaneta americana]|uniref:Uncharacterized protein n=1 Tax=Periplaneta americana TaxID=6978 RepID=A0ABQ8TDX2_PERAM|nr:hypothetical protein ANN_05955 [Periplaneta americana]
MWFLESNSLLNDPYVLGISLELEKAYDGILLANHVIESHGAQQISGAQFLSSSILQSKEHSQCIITLKQLIEKRREEKRREEKRREEKRREEKRREEKRREEKRREEKRREENLETHIGFIDLDKAFDRNLAAQGRPETSILQDLAAMLETDRRRLQTEEPGAHNQSGPSPPVISLWINTISDEENLDLFIAITKSITHLLLHREQHFLWKVKDAKLEPGTLRLNISELFQMYLVHSGCEPLNLLSKNLKVRIYKTVILPVVLYGCETWTLILREEHRLRVFENRVLRKMFGAKRDEVTGEWRTLHSTELQALYSSSDIIRNIKSRRLRWAGHVARICESRNAYRVLVGRPEGKRSLGRPRRRWEDNIKMDLREVRYDDRDWINLAQDRDQWRAYVRAAMNLRVP